MKDSRTLATVGSKEIGLRSVSIERGQRTLGTGVTSADFQIGGMNPTRTEALKIAANSLNGKSQSWY